MYKQYTETNGNSIEFSLSNAEQRDSWLNSSHWTLAADIHIFTNINLLEVILGSF